MHFEEGFCVILQVVCPSFFDFVFFFLYNCTTFENYINYKTENKKMMKSNQEIYPHQTYILLHSKGNHRQNKKGKLQTGRKDLQMMQLKRA